MPILQSHRFAHTPMFDMVKGKIKVYCTGCGAQSGKLENQEEAEGAYRDHLALVGIAEKQRLK